MSNYAADAKPHETVQGERWDVGSEYPAADSDEIVADLARVGRLLDDVDARNRTLTPHLTGVTGAAEPTVADAGPALAEARTIHVLLDEARRLFHNVETYAECSLSVDSGDAPALALLGGLQAVRKRFAAASEPSKQFLDLAPDAVVEAYLADPAVAPARFTVMHSRKRRHELLPLDQETLVAGLAEDGIHAWGRLYDQLAGTLACEVRMDGENRRLGLAEASGLLTRPDEPLRESAWRAINAAWDAHAQSCAAAINAIAGWRLQMCRQRARGGRGGHFLAESLHANRIEQATLDSVLGVARQGVPLARRAARLQAQAYGKTRYGPWDQRAPAPAVAEADPIPYREAVRLIADAYGGINAGMGDFVRMMAAKRWIEGTVGDRKRPGAYCARFRKSRTPRVYMTYTGGASDVITLAHELGHAFHAWTMRDLPDVQCGYGMAIAETASTFGETVVRDALLGRAESPAAQLDIVWEEAAALTTFMLNIPTRFEFERDFYERRAERPLQPDELKARMSAAWETWYGDCLAEPDPLFWASKLHFYISGLSFYNFPYLFGYLFSLGVYARRDAYGDEFFPRYRALLRDTGRMTAEELARETPRSGHHDTEFLARDAVDARGAHRPLRAPGRKDGSVSAATAGIAAARCWACSRSRPVPRTIWRRICAPGWMP